MSLTSRHGELVYVGHRFVVVDGLRLHLLDFGGDGRPILLLHGVVGQAWMWHDVAPLLTGVGHVLALDFRGYGDSQWSADRRYSTEDHASDVSGVATALGADSVDLVGFSWGGLVALALAASSSAVRRLAIVDIPPSSPLAETDVLALPNGFSSHAEAVEGERLLSPLASERMLDVMAAFGTRSTEAGRLVRKHDPLFLERWPFRTDDRWGELRAIDQQLLVVHAEQSRVLSADDAERMVAEARAATLARIPECGHLVPVERPQELARALVSFLSA